VGVQAYDTWGRGGVPGSLLVDVDYVSKWVEALPCKAADAKSARKMFHDIIFPRFGTPRMAISDGGSHFIDKTFRNFLKEFGARHMLASLKYPFYHMIWSWFWLI
jgi:hypothetical protein